MSFSSVFAEHLSRYPAMTARDIIKLCFQAAYGAEHLLTDTVAAERYFFSEWEAADTDTVSPLIEYIAPDAARIHLGAWKREGLPHAWLLRLFILAASEKRGNEARFLQLIGEAKTVLAGADPALLASFEEAMPAYIGAGGGAVHHSEEFRAAYRPSYRVVAGRVLRILPILTALHGKGAALPAVIAIDGRAASGKTTLAGDLSYVLGADTVHMDHFFLPPSLRSAERLGEAGGNVHYERFAEEVLPQLKLSDPFCYRIFDCSCMDYGEDAAIGASGCRIVEGSYSLHPYFGDYADLTVFASVEPEEQMARIVARNGERMAARFRDAWIPMEERYFAAFDVAKKADICV